MTERQITVDDYSDNDGDPRTVTVPTEPNPAPAAYGDKELNAIEAILGEFYMRLRPDERVRIARYIADRLFAEYQQRTGPE